jgi:hypothetical protein
MKLLPNATSAGKLQTRMSIARMKDVICFLSSVLPAARHSKAAAAGNAVISFICPKKRKRKKEKGWIRAGIYLINRGPGYGQS